MPTPGGVFTSIGSGWITGTALTGCVLIGDSPDSLIEPVELAGPLTATFPPTGPIFRDFIDLDYEGMPRHGSRIMQWFVEDVVNVDLPAGSEIR
jgi:hypothetical protein